MKILNFEINTFCRKLKKAFKTNNTREKDSIQADISRVEMSAGILQISEFKFFQLAYAQWYGRELHEGSMEDIFADYMFQNVVPHWVRHFARKVLSLYSEGRLDPREYNIGYVLTPIEQKKTGVLNTILMSVIYLIFFLVLSGHITIQ